MNANDDTNQTYVFLGRLDGKMDMVLANQSAHTLRISEIEKAQRELDTRLTIVEAQKTAKANWTSTGISVLALVVSMTSVVRRFVIGT